MNFNNKLILGKLIKRYKRFFVDVKINKRKVVAHCPNTGSMMGLLKKGNNVWLSETDNPNRKLKYTLQIIEDDRSKVGVNTHLTNKIVLDALNNGLIENFRNSKFVKQEVKFGKNTRFDFLIDRNNKKYFIEVKNVTLSRKKNIAEFPDAITSRGLKHIGELLNAKKKVTKFSPICNSKKDCNEFKLAQDIDPDYCKSLLKAVKKIKYTLL